jgi:hypothetical protein
MRPSTSTGACFSEHLIAVVLKTELVSYPHLSVVVRVANFWRDPSGFSFIGFEY